MRFRINHNYQENVRWCISVLFSQEMVKRRVDYTID